VVLAPRESVTSWSGTLLPVSKFESEAREVFAPTHEPESTTALGEQHSNVQISRTLAIHVKIGSRFVFGRRTPEGRLRVPRVPEPVDVKPPFDAGFAARSRGLTDVILGLEIQGPNNWQE
jgi:hypothetical protein